VVFAFNKPVQFSSSQFKSVLGNFNYLIFSLLRLKISNFYNLDGWKFPTKNEENHTFFCGEYHLKDNQLVIWQMTELPK